MEGTQKRIKDLIKAIREIIVFVREQKQLFSREQTMKLMAMFQNTRFGPHTTDGYGTLMDISLWELTYQISSCLECKVEWNASKQKSPDARSLLTLKITTDPVTVNIVEEKPAINFNDNNGK